MTPRPIILKAAEVRELLAEGTVVIWREVKPQPMVCPLHSPERTLQWRPEPNPLQPGAWRFIVDVGGGIGACKPRTAGDPIDTDWYCPHGQLGQRLWIRERFSTSGLTRYHDTGDPNDHGGPNDRCCAYAADGMYRCGKPIPPAALAPGGHKWCSPVTMHRRLSRPWLVENVGVQVQQVEGVWMWRTTLERRDA